ncbi:hypothetical protein CEXT_429951 [Caerostris extrusa]|uniref:Uncharacterized protein n=1 Tax=Caerostris extrusa TaxID=172846 RepID=A0AAV4S0E4_CAEEX|nr:hypothetical protein CEXT_429951 [Caerostris extrusa]
MSPTLHRRPSIFQQPFDSRPSVCKEKFHVVWTRKCERSLLRPSLCEWCRPRRTDTPNAAVRKQKAVSHQETEGKSVFGETRPSTIRLAFAGRIILPVILVYDLSSRKYYQASAVTRQLSVHRSAMHEVFFQVWASLSPSYTYSWLLEAAVNHPVSKVSENLKMCIFTRKEEDMKNIHSVLSVF